MKTETRIKRYGFITLLSLVVVLSAVIAIITYRYYGVIVRGILGVVFLYLLFWGDSFAKNDIPFKAALYDPKKGKYFLYAFIYPLIAGWAILEILEMILFLRK